MPNYKPWSETEQIIISRFLDACQNQPPFGYTRELAPLLPERSVQDVRNGVNMIRRRRLHLCSGCSSPIAANDTRCEPCLQKQRAGRRNRLAQGQCATCSAPLDAEQGASATLCPQCRARRQSHRPQDLARFKTTAPPKRPADDPLRCLKILSWPSCGHARWIARLAASTQRPVIDLFGGTAEILRLVAVLGGRPHAYYDLDHRIAKIVRHAVYPDRSDPLDLCEATLDLIRERAPKDFDRRTRLLGQTLRPFNPIVACMDALLCLTQDQDHAPKNALFIADPPWPGTRHPAQLPHDLDHAALLDALLDLPYDQDFILSLGAERQALKLAAKHLGQGATFFWRTSGPYNAKSILATSPGLTRSSPDLINCKRIDPASFGCR